MKKLAILFYALSLLTTSSFAQKVTFDEIKSECPDMPLSKKVRLSVSSFQVATVSNPGQLGDELAQMLSDALLQVNCFNVLLSSKDSKQLTDEISFGQSGNTMDGSSPSTGKMKGAQVIVMGKVTSFSEGSKSGGAFGFNISGGNKAKVGLIIQLINPESREIISSTSFETEGKTGGFSGFKALGFNLAGSSSNAAVQDAVHKGIIKAVEFIASKKNLMMPEANSGAPEVQSFSAGNCPMLNSAHSPKIMVLLPESHIGQRFPDPAGETEMNRKFLEAGFQVVDPSIYATINNNFQFKDAVADPSRAISIGKQFGADIIIYGEGVSQRPGTINNPHDLGTQNGQASCRARIEVRAVRTDDATMIATNGLEAGALDNAEFVAAKAALRRAASLAADYLLQQFCSKNITFKGGGTGTSQAHIASNKPITEIVLINADYPKLRALAELLATKGTVLSKSISNGSGNIKLEHAVGTDDDSIAEFIDKNGRASYSITNMDAGKLTILAK